MLDINIDTWAAGCKVRVLPWLDGEHYCVNVQYYAPGSSLERPPAFDKTVYVTANDSGQRALEHFLNSLVEYISRMKIEAGRKYVLTFN